MWGNRLGWMIAGGMVLVMAILITIAFVLSNKRTSPTDFSRNEANFAEIALPYNPRLLLPEQKINGDAGEIYWRAITDYQKNLNDYERLASTFNMERAQGMEGVKAVIEAADYQKASLFNGRTEAAVGYGSRPGVTALHQIGAIVSRIGTEHARKKEFDEARKCLQASFVLGYHLYQQRLSRMQLSAGLGLMAKSAIVLKQIENVQGNKEAADRYDKFVADYQQYYKERIEPLERVITSIDPKVLARHVGDVFVLAEKSSERVWRVEAVLKLGMYKYYTNTPGDRRAARRMVRSLLNDPDPAIQTAALAANELTREQYRTIGSR